MYHQSQWNGEKAEEASAWQTESDIQQYYYMEYNNTVADWLAWRNIQSSGWRKRNLMAAAAVGDINGVMAENIIKRLTASNTYGSQ